MVILVNSVGHCDTVYRCGVFDCLFDCLCLIGLCSDAWLLGGERLALGVAACCVVDWFGFGCWVVVCIAVALCVGL